MLEYAGIGRSSRFFLLFLFIPVGFPFFFVPCSFPFFRFLPFLPVSFRLFLFFLLISSRFFPFLPNSFRFSLFLPVMQSFFEFCPIFFLQFLPFLPDFFSPVFPCFLHFLPFSTQLFYFFLLLAFFLLVFLLFLCYSRFFKMHIFYDFQGLVISTLCAIFSSLSI